MKKEELRKEFIKLKNKGHSYAQCKTIIKAKHDYNITTRTLKRWIKRLDSEEWDLRDISRRPKKIHYKITEKNKEDIILLRKKTGGVTEELQIILMWDTPPLIKYSEKIA